MGLFDVLGALGMEAAKIAVSAAKSYCEDDEDDKYREDEDDEYYDEWKNSDERDNGVPYDKYREVREAEDYGDDSYDDDHDEDWKDN